MKVTGLFLKISIILILLQCKENDRLPYLGQTTTENGKEIHHKVGQLHHFNQDSVLVTNEDLKEYIYVADFFFTSCPSICPKVAKEMLKIYSEVKDEPMVKLVSITIDPKRDDPKKLKLYAENLGVDPKKWIFLTGEKEATFELANTYFVAALEDKESPGGFDHSGKIILVDKEGHIRSFSEGTDPNTTVKIIRDIHRLADEYKKFEKK